MGRNVDTKANSEKEEEKKEEVIRKCRRKIQSMEKNKRK